MPVSADAAKFPEPSPPFIDQFGGGIVRAAAWPWHLISWLPRSFQPFADLELKLPRPVA
jgi:hypothetical protein